MGDFLGKAPPTNRKMEMADLEAQGRVLEAERQARVEVERRRLEGKVSEELELTY